MSAQTITKNVGQIVSIKNLATLDASGSPCQSVTYALNVVTGNPAGLALHMTGVGAPYIACLIEGTYTITLTGTNPDGSITTDAAGDTSLADTIVVAVPPPASQSWQYV